MISKSFFLRQSPPSVFTLCIVAGLLGFISICAPTLVRSDLISTGPIFPWVANSFTMVTPFSYVLLMFCGYFLGLLNSSKPWELGLSTVWFFPVLALIEKSLVITSHRFFALEFLFWLWLGLAGVAGVYLARLRRSNRL